MMQMRELGMDELAEIEAERRELLAERAEIDMEIHACKARKPTSREALDRKSRHLQDLGRLAQENQSRIALLKAEREEIKKRRGIDVLSLLQTLLAEVRDLRAEVADLRSEVLL